MEILRINLYLLCLLNGLPFTVKLKKTVMGKREEQKKSTQEVHKDLLLKNLQSLNVKSFK